MSESNDPGPMSWVMNERDLLQLSEAIRGASQVVMDLETTGLAEHAFTGGPLNGGVAARIALASFTLPQADAEGDWDGVEPSTYILPLSHPNSVWLGSWRTVLARLLQVMVTLNKPLENANVKFDAKWVEACTGVDVAHLITWDSQVSSHLLDENASTKLKERAPRTFGIPRWDDDIDLTRPGAAERADLWVLGEYAGRDTYWTWRLILRHRQEMYLDNPDGEQPESPEETQNARLGKLATWVAMPMVASLTKIEQRGFRLDVPWVEEKLSALEAEGRTAMHTLCERFDMDESRSSAQATSKWFIELTQRAVERNELIVAAMTPGGNPQWSKGVLRRQVRTGSVAAELILQVRGATKGAEFLRSWLENVSPEGFIHTTYWPGRVVTGRLSSEGPNMQQVSKKLKNAFIPREGYYIIDLDYSQIELRVAAFIARCEPMIVAFKEGRDLHKMLASLVVGQPEEQIGPEDRQAGKSANFGLLYGMGAYGFQQYAEDVYGVHLSESEALAFHRAFFDLWEGLREWHQSTIRRAHHQGYVTSPIGRVRRLPDIYDGNPKVVSFAERKAINSPVQGFASDMMQTAAASIQGVLPGDARLPGLELVGTVHDSIVGEVEIDRWEEIAAAAQERMTALDQVLARMGVDFDVPLVADATVGTRWGLDDISNPKETVA